MTQGQYTTKRRTFQHLTKEKRAQIEILVCQGIPKIRIARAVGISRSTLYRELSRRLEKIAELYGENFENIFNNGSEFVDLGRYLPKSTRVYYAHPYSSYERNTNEKQNSLVRRFFPKGKSLDNIADEQVAFVEHWINNLPRKIFNYHSADFVFHNVLFDIAI